MTEHPEEKFSVHKLKIESIHGPWYDYYIKVRCTKAIWKMLQEKRAYLMTKCGHLNKEIFDVQY